LLSVLALAMATVFSTADLLGQGASLARVPVRVIQGKLVVECDISTRFRRLPVNLFVDYDSPCGLQLHNQAAAGLRCESPDGRTVPITLHLGGLEVTVDRREHGDQDFYDDFTKYHSIELGEKAAVGTIGGELLSQYFIAFDIGQGLLELGAPRQEDPASRDPVEGATVVPITEVNGLSWLPVRHKDGTPGALAVGTSRYDSVVDTAICDRWDRPAGNLPSLKLGALELTEFVAFRPEEVIQVHPDGVVGVLGLGLLESLRVELDRVNRVAVIRQTSAANYPAADFAFFEAMIEDDPEPLAAFLEQYPDARLSREAAERLLDFRLDEGGDPAACTLAIQCLHRTYPADLRTTAMLDLVKTLVEAEHPEQAIIAGTLGVPDGRVDRYPNAVHQLHAKLGNLQLDRDAKAAWKHLLSAAFGLPEDGMINLDLGRFYEREGRLRRAFSRYVQAVIKPESGPAALEALHRLQQKMDGGDRMSVDRIEELVAGKVHGFGAATVFRPDPGDFDGRVALVEFLTNANLGNAERGGSIGGALANDGLVSHFTNEHVAFITYHLVAPEPVPLTNELAVHMGDYYGAQPTVHIVNGLRVAPGAGKWRDKEAIYNECRKAVVVALRRPTEYQIDVSAEVVEGVLEGRATVSGPAARDVVVQLVLVERGVLFPGRSEVVVHRNVARAWLTDSIFGAEYEPVEGSMALEFRRPLDAVAEANAAFLDDLEARGGGATMRISLDLDPAQLAVVAVVRNQRTREVLQASQVRCTVPNGGPR